MHKVSMESFKREKEIMKRKASATANVFRAAITDLSSLGQLQDISKRYLFWRVVMWMLAISVMAEINSIKFFTV